MTELVADPLRARAASGDVKTEEMILNMGPQHPSTHGVLRVVVRIDGEIVLDCEPHLGFLHRSFEKIAESVNYTQVTPYTDRMDYLMSMGNNLGYCMAVEKLVGEPVPDRAWHIRTIVVELDRIASHLIAIGTYGLDAGALTPFFYALRDREKILRIFEEICGQRLNYNYVRIGGVAYDLPEGIEKSILDFCDYFEPKVDEWDRLLTYNGIFIKRVANVGVLPVPLALDWGITGPCLRGSGVKRDLRKDPGYGIYSKFEFDVPVGRGEVGTVGDCWDRYIVRVREIRESLKIIRQATKALPAGDHLAAWAKRRVRPPKGDAYTKIENARGELGFYLISDGTDKPFRLKTRGPSFCNIAVLPEISRGCMIADLIVIIGSIDIVVGETDR